MASIDLKSPNASDILLRAVSSALENAVASIVEEEAEAASKRVRERVAAETGNIVARVTAQVSVMHHAQELVIRFGGP